MARTLLFIQAVIGTLAHGTTTKNTDMESLYARMAPGKLHKNHFACLGRSILWQWSFVLSEREQKMTKNPHSVCCHVNMLPKLRLLVFAKCWWISLKTKIWISLLTGWLCNERVKRGLSGFFKQWKPTIWWKILEIGHEYSDWVGTRLISFPEETGINLVPKLVTLLASNLQYFSCKFVLAMRRYDENARNFKMPLLIRFIWPSGFKTSERLIFKRVL